jgi:hypothetical protein
MNDFEQKQELWRQAFFAYREFKAICHEINGSKRGRRKKKMGLVTRLRCGCEPHGHKCLVAEGGCGRCVGHCICPTQTSRQAFGDWAADRLRDTEAELLNQAIVSEAFHAGFKAANKLQ